MRTKLIASLAILALVGLFTPWAHAAGQTGPVGDIFAVYTPGNGGLIGGAAQGEITARLKSCAAGRVLIGQATVGDWDCSAASGITGTLTTNYIPKAASASTLTDSIMSETTGLITVTGSLSSTTVTHGLALRWGTDPNGTTGAMHVNTGAGLSYYDFDEDYLVFRGIDNAYIETLVVDSAFGTVYAQHDAILNNLDGDTIIKGNASIGDADTDLHTVAGRVGVRASPTSSKALYIDSSGITHGIHVTAAHSAFAGDVQAVQNEVTGTINATAATRTVWGVRSNVSTTRSAGANNVTNYGVYSSASGAQLNYAFYGAAGVLHNVNAIETDSNADIAGSIRITATGGSSYIQSGTSFATSVQPIRFTGINAATTLAVMDTSGNFSAYGYIEIGGVGGTKHRRGSGSPNSVVVGSPGDTYVSTAGGASTTFYVKESGSATNTGWVAYGTGGGGGFSVAGDGLTSSGSTVDAVARVRAAPGDWGIEIRANDIGLTDNCTNGQILKYDDGSGGVLHTGEWDCATDNGVTGTGTGGRVTRWLTANTIGDAALRDDGTTASIGMAPSANANIASDQSARQHGVYTLATYSAFTSNANGAVADIAGTLNTTGAALEVTGFNASIATTRSAGANNLTNTALKCNASGAQQNFCYYGVSGGFYNAGAGTFGSTLIVGSTLSASADATVATTLRLNSTSVIQWPQSSVDAGIGRNAAGAIEANNGTLNTLGVFVARSFQATQTTSGGGLIVNAPASPTFAQGSLKANSLGNLMLMTYAADNSVVGYDLEWTGGNWIARHTNYATIFKTSATIAVTGVSGATLNSNQNTNYSNATNLTTGIFTKWDIATGTMTTRTAAVFNGNLTLGDASADTIGINGTATVAAPFNTKGFLRDDATGPTITSCGTGPTVTAGKNAFTVTPGTGTVLTCTATFSTAFATAPSCVMSFRDGTKAALVTYTTSTTAFTITVASSSIASAPFDVVCIGH